MQAAQADVVLQPQQHLSPAHRRQRRRRQLGDVGDGAFAKRVDHQRLGSRRPQRQHEMAGKVHPGGIPAGGVGGVHPQDAERHRQAAAALDHADQIGVGQVVIGLGVAAIAEPAGQQAGEERGLSGQVVRRRAAGRGVAGDGAQVSAHRPRVAVRRVDAGQQQGRAGEVDLVIRQHADGVQRVARVRQAGSPRRS